MRASRRIIKNGKYKEVFYPVVFYYEDDAEHGFVPDSPNPLPIILDDRMLANRLETKLSALWGAIIQKKKQYTAFYIRRSGKARLIHKPSKTLGYIQHMLLQKVLNFVPMQAHIVAYVPGRSCAYGANKHTHQGTVLSLDIEDFFHSVKRAQIRKALCAFYPRRVAHLMAELTTCENFVPQGAATSGAVANLVAQNTFDSDILAAFPNWNYTRYSDDLVLSNPNEVNELYLKDMAAHVERILRWHGFVLNKKKTRWAYAHETQIVLGLQVNRGVCLPMKRYRHIRAQLRVCARDGLEPWAERRGVAEAELYTYLKGVMSYVHDVDEKRWAALLPLFQKIEPFAV